MIKIKTLNTLNSLTLVTIFVISNKLIASVNINQLDTNYSCSSLPSIMQEFSVSEYDINELKISFKDLAYNPVLISNIYINKKNCQEILNQYSISCNAETARLVINRSSMNILENDEYEINNLNLSFQGVDYNAQANYNINGVFNTITAMYLSSCESA